MRRREGLSQVGRPPVFTAECAENVEVNKEISELCALGGLHKSSMGGKPCGGVGKAIDKMGTRV
jgi:hypothetical protein